MSDLSGYESTMTFEDAVQLKVNKYRDMATKNPAQFSNLFDNAKKAQLEGKPWKPETNEAIKTVGLETGLIAETA